MFFDGENGVTVSLLGLNGRPLYFRGATNLDYTPRRVRVGRKVLVLVSAPHARGWRWVTILWRRGRIRFESIYLPTEIMGFGP